MDNCKQVRDKILDEVSRGIKMLKEPPKLAIIKCNNDFGSEIYVRNKVKTCENAGIKVDLVELNPDETNYTQLHNTVIKAVNENDSVIIQFPLCDKFKQYENELLKIIPYYKDCDGIVSQNILNLYDNNKSILPCTVGGIDQLLKYHNINVEGKNVVVIGRSKIVGKPMAQLMINQNATVTVCHSKTKNLKSVTKNADILIVAIGKPKMINHEYVKNGAIVVDVGINRNENNKVCGDCDYDDLKNICSLITPVPRGIGTLTTAMVAYNVLECVKLNEQRCENEVWKDIYYIDSISGKLIDYRGKYQVSNLGRVKSLKDNHGNYREKILQENIDDKHHYRYVNLYNNSKKEFKEIHRIVAHMFIDNPYNLPYVNHKDENKENNCVENLEWCNHEYNMNYGTAIKRKSEKLIGVPKTKEYKQKQSDVMKGKYTDDKNPSFKDYIVCTDKNGNFIGEYKGRTEAKNDIENKFNIILNKNGITRCCHANEIKSKTRTTYKDFKFYYLKDYLNINNNYKSIFED